jgi:hypothetical protein
MRNIIILIILFSVACTEKKQTNGKKNLDFGSFTIETPASWKKEKVKGIDSYVGKIVIDSNETLEFDLGWYSNTLTENDSVENKNNIIMWDTIDRKKVKIVIPKQSGKGITGIYIDSLWQSGSEIDKFNLYGINLKPTNEKALLQALKTLKFYEEK